MPIWIPNDLPAAETLQNENIFVPKNIFFGKNGKSRGVALRNREKSDIIHLLESFICE